MKSIKIFSFFLFLTISSLSAQEKEIVEISFRVEGICDMCEERIENALSVKGVKSADWDLKTHQCKVVFRSDKISEEEIHKLLNEVGHDTEKSKASDEQYSRVHTCCRYREGHDH